MRMRVVGVGVVVIGLLVTCRLASAQVATWAARLGDPQQSERAVTELEQLGDPAAIAPLGDAWLAQGRAPRLLAVVIELARPASWAAALPYLRRALLEVKEAEPRSVDSAIKAADALGEAKLGADALIALAGKPPTKKLVFAEVAAMRALGHFDSAADKPTVAAALVKILAREPPRNPRTVTAPAEQRTLAEADTLYLATTAAAVNALGPLAVPSSAKPLVLAMYRAPPLMMQVRRALVALGPAAEAELRAALAGTNADVTKLVKDKHLDRYCGDHESSPCTPVSAREFYAAVALGDLHDAAAVPDLLAVLQHPAAPSYYEDDAPSPTTQHTAALDALRKLGAPAAANALHDRWTAPGDAAERAAAISAYAFVAPDDSAAADLAAIATDHSADDPLRTEAATALARLTRDPKHVATLRTLAQTYLDAAAHKRREAESYRADADTADAAYESAKQAAQRAKQAALAAANDPATTAAQIKTAADAARAAEDALKIANKAHRERVLPFRERDTAAKAYTSYAHELFGDLARVEIAQRCRADLACFAASLTQSPDAAVAHVASSIPDVATWSADDKRALADAAIDRALLELGKRGTAASAYTAALLDAAASDEREVRAAALLALPKIAARPCASCVTKLDAAIAAGEGKTTLGDLTAEAGILRAYFAAPAPAP